METVGRSTTGEDNIVQRLNGSSTSTSLSDNGDAIDTQRSSYNKTRMKWSRDMNIATMRSHFKAMVLAPNTYTKSMHEYFLEFFPRLAVTAQRVIDQKRAILKRATRQQEPPPRAMASKTRNTSDRRRNQYIISISTN